MNKEKILKVENEYTEIDKFIQENFDTKIDLPYKHKLLNNKPPKIVDSEIESEIANKVNYIDKHDLINKLASRTYYDRIKYVVKVGLPEDIEKYLNLTKRKFFIDILSATLNTNGELCLILIKMAKFV